MAQANVTVTNLASNTSITAQTNETGSYVTPFLAPGTYRLTIEAKGFKRFVREDILLQSQDKARLDARLELGDLTQSVTVTGAGIEEAQYEYEVCFRCHGDSAEG